MIILGVNDTHDASACIIRDGELLVALAEERVQRVKGMAGFPAGAIDSCLSSAGLKRSDIDLVAVGNKHIVPNNMWNLSATLSVQDHLRMQDEYYRPWIYDGRGPALAEVFPAYEPKGRLGYPMEDIPLMTLTEPGEGMLDRINEIRKSHIANFLEIDLSKILFFDHHRCHAYYGYFMTADKKDRMAVVTSDSGGDGAYTTVSVVNDGVFTEIHRARSSLIGKIYSTVTLMMGMRPNEHEYKVMGLAPYASEFHKRGPRKVFQEALRVNGMQFEKSAHVTDQFHYFEKALRGFRFDGIAGGVQDFVEELLVEWFRNIGQETQCENFVYCGGVANNIKATKRVAEMDEVSSIFVPAGPGDENLCIGAAYCAIYDTLGAAAAKEVIRPLSNAYWGTGLAEDDINAFHEHPFIINHYECIPGAPMELVANVLAEGEVVALIRGKMEFGARALGHRSLVADPSNPNSLRKINDLIKKRDFWMPFTPSLLDESYDDYVVNPKKLDSSYMTMSFETTPLGKKHLCSAIHPYDGTVRPQRVTPQLCRHYYALIRAFKNKTGVGGLLNTSLNIHGRPIVMRPLDLINEVLEGGVPLKYVLVEDRFYMAKS